MISAPHATIVKRRLKGKVRIGNGVSAQGTSALGGWPSCLAASAGPCGGRRHGNKVGFLCGWQGG